MLRLGSNKIFSPCRVKVLSEIKTMDITFSDSVEKHSRRFHSSKMKCWRIYAKKKSLLLNKQPYNRWLKDNKSTAMWIRLVFCVCAHSFLLCGILFVHSVWRNQILCYEWASQNSIGIRKRTVVSMAQQSLCIFLLPSSTHLLLIMCFLSYAATMQYHAAIRTVCCFFYLLFFVFTLDVRINGIPIKLHNLHGTVYCAFDVKNNLAHCFAIEPLLLLNAWLSSTFVPQLPRKVNFIAHFGCAQ